MDKSEQGGFDRFRNKARTRVITGVVILVPLVVTFLTLRLVFLWLDSLAQPLVKQFIGSDRDIPGLGIVLTFLVIWLAGLIGGNVMGRRMIGRGDNFLARLPLIGSIYSPVKQFIETIVASNPDRGNFRRVVLAEYPSEGIWILGFATGEVQASEGGEPGRCVFVPTSPNPATGWMCIFPPEKVRETNLSVEEAMRLIVSGGIVVPGALGEAWGGTQEGAPTEIDLGEPPGAGRSQV